MVAALVLVAVLVAGCASPTTTSPTPSTATSTATSTAGTHDAFLNQYVVSMQQELTNNTTVSAWAAKWQNGSTVSIETTYKNVTSNKDVNLNITVIRFASISDATNYVNANKAGVETTNMTKVTSLYYRAYELTKGSAPTVYRAWTNFEIRDLRLITIQQIDDTVIIDSVGLSANSAVAS